MRQAVACFRLLLTQKKKALIILQQCTVYSGKDYWELFARPQKCVQMQMLPFNRQTKKNLDEEQKAQH